MAGGNRCSRFYSKELLRIYKGDDSFLSTATKRTKELMKRVNTLFEVEKQFGGVLDVDTETISTVTAYAPGYIEKDSEIIVGMQTNRPLKRGVNPFGGIRMARGACEAYGYKLSDEIEKKFKYRTTHNDGVFKAYTDEMRKARHSHLITGLPDAYGRGRIIGDYRRVALYGIDRLIEERKRTRRLFRALILMRSISVYPKSFQIRYRRFPILKKWRKATALI